MVAKRSNSTVHKLTEGALSVALATILSLIKIYTLPNGGSITAFSWVPLVINGYRNGPKWGAFSGAVFAIIQIILNPAPVFAAPTLVSQIGSVFLDYVIPSAILGCTVLFTKPFKNKLVGIGVATAIVCAINFISVFISGLLIWGGYAPAGQPIYLYSLLYNGSYSLPESIITILGVVLLYRYAKRLFVSQ